MSKKTVVIPTNKRLPQGNISRLMQILHNKLCEKARQSCMTAAKNCHQACINYLTAATKKHGLNAMATLKMSKVGHIYVELTAKTKNDLKRIRAPYEQEYINEGHFYVPANKVKEFEDAIQNLHDLEILLLTANADEALVMFTAAEQQIEGIK